MKNESKSCSMQACSFPCCLSFHEIYFSWIILESAGVLPGKAAVMQICANTSLCHVMHIFHSGITQSLQFLLEDSKLVKVSEILHWLLYFLYIWFLSPFFYDRFNCLH
jgi:hypothetical protein